MIARIRAAVGAWLCRRGRHRFVPNPLRCYDGGEYRSAFNEVCDRLGCGHGRRWVRDTWVPTMPPQDIHNDRATSERLAEKDLLFAERYGSTPRRIFKVEGLTPQGAKKLLDQFQKESPLADKGGHDRPEAGRAYPYRYSIRRHNRWLREADRLLRSMDWYDQTRGSNASELSPEGPSFKDLVRAAEALARAARRARRHR